MHLSEFLDLVFDVDNASANNFADLLAVLEVAKGGHSTDLDFFGNSLQRNSLVSKP